MDTIKPTCGFDQRMKYIFIIGAPGSKWSSVAKNIYYSSLIDRTDDNNDRVYASAVAYNGSPMHQGSYFDPGMEFELPLDLHMKTRTELESIFDQPFSGTGIRIIKGHTLAHHIDYIKDVWPDCPIVLVHRENDACLGWWVRCGGFDITYPDYRPYYQNYARMAYCIDRQNMDIMESWTKYPGTTPENNHELAKILGISPVDQQYQHNYASHDVAVKVI